MKTEMILLSSLTLATADALTVRLCGASLGTIPCLAFLCCMAAAVTLAVCAAETLFARH